MNWILLVTWIIPGQPPQTSSYQTQFHSAQACAAAADAVLKSAIEMRQQMFADAGNNEMIRMATALKYPYASAVCSEQ